MPEPMQVMVVDDEDTIREALSAWLGKEGYQVDTAESGHAALEKLEKQPYDMLLVDIKMPGMDGLELLGRVKEQQPDATVIMITAHGSIQSAVEAMKKGATDYLCKPFDPEELSLLMERAAATIALREENLALREQLNQTKEAAFGKIVGQSEAMREILSTIEDVALTEAPILITGQTGVGKEMVARAVHLHSERAYGPFVAINCGAQAESLLESELFGHEKGAFTGAVKARRGRLEMADKGTLFLDEVGEISAKMQISLLRVLEEKTFQRVGGTRPIESDFRLVSATHRDLTQLISEGRFREDFFYRINVITINVPSLSERSDDIVLLADHFLNKYAGETGKRMNGFTQEAYDILDAYAWPGNVRELRNVIERAVVIARGRMIGAEELTFLNPDAGQRRAGTATLKQAEIGHIVAALERSGYNVTQAARQLDIDRVTLTRKMKRYNITRP